MGQRGHPTPTEVDRYVSRRLRERRCSLGLSQDALAELTGLSGSQIAKYDSGKNRISCARLHKFATVLGVEVAWFFEGLENGHTPDPGAARTLSLLRHYAAAPPECQRLIIDMSRAFANGDDDA